MDNDDIIKTIRSAIAGKESIDLDEAIEWIWSAAHNTGDVIAFTDILDELLVTPNHCQHQVIAKTLQDLKNPSSIPFAEKALASGFDYLSYTCSENGVIAKWFSWLLFEIGTTEAIEVMKKYAQDPDEDIRKEMRYRLAKIK
jgi:hypothetical protein